MERHSPLTGLSSLTLVGHASIVPRWKELSRTTEFWKCKCLMPPHFVPNRQAFRLLEQREGVAELIAAHLGPDSL